MVFTQGHGFVLGASIGLPRSFAPLSRFGLPRRGHRLFGNACSLGKLMAVATFIGFGEKRCRKNLPLCDLPAAISMTDNPSATADPASKSKRWKRFSIRGMLFATTCLAIFMAHRTNIARREAPALKMVREHGCTPRYRHDIFGNFPSLAPLFLREAMGVENFGSVVRLNFADGTPKSDEAFSMLDRLPNVTVVNTDGSMITNDGLAPIANLAWLNTLRLKNAAQISDQGLRHLRDLKHLELLDLSGLPITDQGLRELRELAKLEILSLDNTGVTDNGLSHLACLTRLKLLKVQRTAVTQQGVAELKRHIPNCQIEFDR